MPLDDDLSKELKSHLKLAKSKTLNFGLCLGKKPEDTAWMMDKKRPAELLLKEARKAPGVERAKACSGVLAVEGSKILISCAEDPPTGIVKKLKAFLKAHKLPFKPIVTAPDGSTFEADEDEEAAAVADASPEVKADGPVEKWLKLLPELAPRIEEAASQGHTDASKLRAAWAMAIEAADGGDPAKALAIADRLMPLLEKAPEAEEPSAPLDKDAAKWKLMHDKMLPVVEAALAAGKGDVGKIRAVWDYALGKAAAQDHAAALKSLTPLKALIDAAGAQSKTEAERASGRGKSDGEALLALREEFKGKQDAIKEAIKTLPDRDADIRSDIAELTEALTGSDLMAANVAMTKLDGHVRDAERRRAFLAEEKKKFDAFYKASLKPVNAVLKDLSSKIPGAQELKKTAIDAFKVTTDHAKDGAFDKANEGVPDARAALEALLAEKKRQDDAGARYMPARKALRIRYNAATDAAYLGAPALEPLQKTMVAEYKKSRAPSTIGWYTEAESFLPAANEAMDALEAEMAKYDAAKKTYEDEFTGLEDDLKRIKKVGSVNDEIGRLRKAVLDQEAKVKAAADARDFDRANPALIELAVRVDALDKAKQNYDAAKAKYETEWAAQRMRLRLIEDLGALGQPLDALVFAVLDAADKTRAAADRHDFAEATTLLADMVTKAEAFERAKAQADASRDADFADARKVGADTVESFAHPADTALGAAAKSVEEAMEGDKSLGKSEGLAEILAAAKEVDKLYAKATAGADPAALDAAKNAIAAGLVKCRAYQGKHKEDARSKSDRAKYTQAQAIAMSFETQALKLAEIEPIITKLDGFDATATAANEATALRELGWLDALIAGDAPKALKLKAKEVRGALANALMKTAADKSKVAAMLGGEFKAGYDRQIAMGPLADTAMASTSRADHASTRIQKGADVESVDRSKRVAGRLIGPAGEFDAVGLYALDLEGLPQDTEAGREMVSKLKKLRDAPEAQAILDTIDAPDPAGPASKMIRAQLGLDPDAVVTEAQAKQAALAAYLAPLRQKDVGSCFATQVAIDVQKTRPADFLRDMSAIFETGVLSRTYRGETIETPLETTMSDKALETSTVKLGKAGGQLKGAGRDTLDAPTGLEEAPAFQNVMAKLGIDPGDSKDKMDAAIAAMQTRDAFAENQNEKALRQAVKGISNAADRADVFKDAMKGLDADAATVEAALDAAMAGVAALIEEAIREWTAHANALAAGAEKTAANKEVAQLTARRDALTAAGATAVKTAFTDKLAEADFDVEPGLIVRELVMAELGISQAQIDAAEAYRALEKEIKGDPRMNEVDDRGQQVQLVKGQDDALIAKLTKLEADGKAIPWVKLAELEARTQDCYDAYTGGEDDRLLRAWEYTVTALCEKGDYQTGTKAMQAANRTLIEEKFDDVFENASSETKLSTKKLNAIADALWHEYERLWHAKTSSGYDASVASELSADGSSSRGGHYLYDTQGISDPTKWIKIDDGKKYQVLVSGLMMLAWANLYGDEKDKKTHSASRLLADSLAEELSKESFVTEASERIQKATGKPSNKPWERVGGGFSNDVIGIYEEREVTEIGLGADAPADAEDLMGRVGGLLKGMWDAPNSPLKATSDSDPDNAKVNAGNAGVHVFSLTPGNDKMKAILNDARGVDAALAEFKAAEKAKWDAAGAGTHIPDRDACMAVCKAAYSKAPDWFIDQIWRDAQAAAGTNPVTHKAVTDAIVAQRLSSNPTSSPEALADLEARTTVRSLVPPVDPADLDAKLAKLATTAKVPDDLADAVIGHAKTALTKAPPAPVTMTEIQAAFDAAVKAEGMDGSTVDHAAVMDALREPPGLIFADSNWGDAEHSVKYAMVVNPRSGEMEMWQMNEDGSGAFKMDQKKWVQTEWSAIT